MIVEFIKLFLYLQDFEVFLCYEANQMVKKIVPIVRGFALRANVRMNGTNSGKSYQAHHVYFIVANK